MDTEALIEERFPMHTRSGVETFLQHYNHIKEAMYFAGDYDAVVLLVDFEDAVTNCKLSAGEARAIHHVFIEDLQRVDVAKRFGVTKQTIQKQLERGTTKLAKYYAEMGGIAYE